MLESDRQIRTNWQNLLSVQKDKLSPAEQENANFVNNVIAPNSSPMPPFPVEGSTEAQDLLRKLEEKVKYGEYTAQQAADEYFTEANKMLQGE